MKEIAGCDVRAWRGFGAIEQDRVLKSANTGRTAELERTDLAGIACELH